MPPSCMSPGVLISLLPKHWDSSKKDLHGQQMAKGINDASSGNARVVATFSRNRLEGAGEFDD